MNPIETQWHQLKSHEIAGQMFDNEYDLAAVPQDRFLCFHTLEGVSFNL